MPQAAVRADRGGMSAVAQGAERGNVRPEQQHRYSRLANQLEDTAYEISRAERITAVFDHEGNRDIESVDLVSQCLGDRRHREPSRRQRQHRDHRWGLPGGGTQNRP
jgi:hypothetical protein